MGTQCRASSKRISIAELQQVATTRFVFGFCSSV
jgi:hypothetical protein